MILTDDLGIIHALSSRRLTDSCSSDPIIALIFCFDVYSNKNRLVEREEGIGGGEEARIGSPDVSDCT